MLPCASRSLSTRKNIQYAQSPVKSAWVDLSLKSGDFFSLAKPVLSDQLSVFVPSGGVLKAESLDVSGQTASCP